MSGLLCSHSRENVTPQDVYFPPFARHSNSLRASIVSSHIDVPGIMDHDEAMKEERVQRVTEFLI